MGVEPAKTPHKKKQEWSNKERHFSFLRNTKPISTNKDNYKSNHETGTPFIYLSYFSYEISSEDHLSYLKAASLLYTLRPNSKAITASSTGSRTFFRLVTIRSLYSMKFRVSAEWEKKERTSVIAQPSRRIYLSNSCKPEPLNKMCFF